MAIAVSTDQILVDIRSWYYRLRMVQAHLDRSADSLILHSRERLYIQDVICDLLEACEDAEAFISREAEKLEAEAQAGLGPVRGHQPDSAGEPRC